jgi:hypothetical protein
MFYHTAEFLWIYCWNGVIEKMAKKKNISPNLRTIER